MIEIEKTRMIWRFIADVGCLEEAKDVQSEIMNKLSSICYDIINLKTQPYWKIDGTYEITFDSIAKEQFHSLNTFLETLGNGWEIHEENYDSWAVWNRLENNNLFLDIIRWANVEIISR
jgi:hypothetical protein